VTWLAVLGWVFSAVLTIMYEWRRRRLTQRVQDTVQEANNRMAEAADLAQQAQSSQARADAERMSDLDALKAVNRRHSGGPLP